MPVESFYQLVEKERKLSPTELAAEARVLARIADRLAPLVQASLTSGLLIFRERVDLRGIEALVERGALAEIENLVPWELLSDDVRALERIYQRGIVQGGEGSAEFFRRSASNLLPAITANQFTFNPNNPAVEREILKRTGLLIQGVEERSRQAIRTIIIQGQLNGVPPRETAKLVKQVIGLTPKQAVAVANFKANILNEKMGRITRLGREAIAPKLAGLSLNDADNRKRFLAAAGKKSIDKMGDDYADRLLSKRAENIARTETFAAANIGQKVVWDQAADDGLFDRSRAKKRWHTTVDEKTCPICIPLEGIEVPMDALFPGGFDRPPSPHSQCRCHISLVLPEL